MKIAYIVTLSLLFSLLPALSYSGAYECPRLVRVTAPVDSDNDGTPDEYDALPDGNAVVVISIDSMVFNGTYDPNIAVALDGNGNDILDPAEWKTVSIDNVSSVTGSGFGTGDLWYGVDISDNLTTILFGVGASNGTGGEGNFFDLSPLNGQFNVLGMFEMRNGTERTERINITSSGSGDNHTGIGDAEVEFHVEVIMGPTIVEADPTPTKYLTELVTVLMKEGDSKLFTIEDVKYPKEVGVNISYEWYLGLFENLSGPPGDYYCVQNSSSNATNSFELYANFGSEGLYGLYCIAFMDLGNGLPYWFDMKAWGISIEHFNTVPRPMIDVTPSEWITQLDSVSISGFRSYDRDGDELAFEWYVDGKYASNQTEFEHVFVNAGLHSIKLEVTDDENVTAVAYRNVTVNNIPTPDDAQMSAMLLGDMIWTVPNNFTRLMVERRSVSTNLELPFGYGLIASFSLVSEVLIKHWGDMTFEFEDMGTNYTYNMTGSEDRFSVGFRPYLDLQLIVLKDDERWDLINGTVPLPLQNNDLGLDRDGDPYLYIPTLTRGIIDVYTWDLFREIYNGTDSEMGELSVNVEDIDMLEVDIFKFAAAALGLVIDQYAFLIGEAFNLLDVFANLYILNRFDVKVDVQKDIYLLIDHHGSDYNDLELLEPGKMVRPGGSLDDRDIYIMTSASMDVLMTPSLSLKFRLTDWGRGAYGTYDVFKKSGIIVGFVKTVYSFITTGSAPKKDFTFDTVLWEGSTSLEMSGDVRNIYPSYFVYSSDQDHDGVININDPFPLDGAAWLDSDGDGMPDELHGNSSTGLVEDEDDDNDGVLDGDDKYPLDPERTGKESKPWEDADVVIIVVIIGVVLLAAVLALLVWVNRDNEGKSWGKDEE